jgi:non-ribosomal peptide synthetase component E (peptide arylation enzyme)
VASGTDGEILVRGPAMFLGYADEAQTRESLTEDGFFRTGDIGRLTAGGALVITGRKKDLIIRGGENISAKEIEDVLHTHPGIKEAAVVSMPHPRLGEGICAYLIPMGDERPDIAALSSFVSAAGLAKQKCPERIEWVDALPRTASGKIRKDQLRAMIKALVEGG